MVWNYIYIVVVVDFYFKMNNTSMNEQPLIAKRLSGKGNTIIQYSDVIVSAMVSQSPVYDVLAKRET